jgi:hypothetical protein
VIDAIATLEKPPIIACFDEIPDDAPPARCPSPAASRIVPLLAEACVSPAHAAARPRRVDDQANGHARPRDHEPRVSDAHGSGRKSWRGDAFLPLPQGEGRGEGLLRCSSFSRCYTHSDLIFLPSSAM